MKERNSVGAPAEVTIIETPTSLMVVINIQKAIFAMIKMIAVAVTDKEEMEGEMEMMDEVGIGVQTEIGTVAGVQLQTGTIEELIIISETRIKGRGIGVRVGRGSAGLRIERAREQPRLLVLMTLSFPERERERETIQIDIKCD